MVRGLFALLLIAACAHAPADSSATDRPPVAVRVVSYNIHHGRGLDDRVDLERTADVLRRFDADIVALQEVDERVERSGGVDQAARLGELLGMHHVFGSFFDYQGGRYGMAILARCPLRRAEPVRLPDGNEPRIALVAEIELADGRALSVVNVHFDWVDDDRLRYAQARRVADLIEELEGPFLLLGDFNDVPGSRTLALFHRLATEAGKPAGGAFTFPSTEPAREIDYVFVSRSDAWVIDSVSVGIETMASDHRPVVAVLGLGSSAASRSAAERPESTSAGRFECAGAS